VLTGRAELSDVLQPWGSSDVSILAGGPLPPNPSELLSSTQMTSLLSQLRDRFDFVILDSPPLLPVTDAALLARISDGALVVVRYGRTRREHLERCLHSLTSIGARVLGSVVNMAPVRSGSAYGYGYGYERRAPVPVSVPDQGAGDPARPEASTAPPSR
jgi:non-specific protein-tyrosine kinase